ncbi:MAG: alpha/beta hydrolase [Armatimonadetes bacterium]|nr:alpha/beta hydrolase [Armatimonadota bacterium]
MRASVIANPSWAALEAAGLLPAGARTGGTSRLGVVYGRAGGEELLLDLHLPVRRSKPRPGLVLVHGGGWSGGSREGFTALAGLAATLGYVVANVDYRLTGTAPWPACLDDCQRAVRWVRKQADELGLDPERLAAVGSSAGGHLAACLGVRDTRDDSDPELAGIASRVRWVVDIHGVHDFEALEHDEVVQECCYPLLGRPGERPEAWHDASPIEHVDERAAAMLLVHDPGDTVVPYAQTVRFAERLMAAGRPVQFEPVPGAGHGFAYDAANTWSRHIQAVAAAWLARWLQP